MSNRPLAIANKVIAAAEANGQALTIMQVIKLVYIAHGWNLALLNKPLVNSPPEAWQHGPVYPEIYNYYRGYRSSPINSTAKDPNTGSEYNAQLDEATQSIIDQVVASYGKLHAFTLSDRTHQPNTPWSKIYNGGVGQFDPIPNDIIRNHFDSLKAEPA